jgi:spore coat polysaccharide biosynthesis protein SpsF (cytidylyltransferase family)
MSLAGMPSILFMCDRVRRARSVDALCLATSTDSSDDPLAKVATAAGVAVHRGSLDDVLDRFVGAARAQQAQRVVRLTGDCPLVDPDVIDQVVAALEADIDYASNVEPPTFPDGLDVEVMTRSALERASTESVLPSEREHVTPYLRNYSAFRQVNVRGSVDLSALRWTVDYSDDYEYVRRLVETVRGNPVEADRFDYLRAHDRLGGAQGMHDRNEGLAKSVAADQTTRAQD